VQKLATFDRWR